MTPPVVPVPAASLAPGGVSGNHPVKVITDRPVQPVGVRAFGSRRTGTL